MRAGVLVLFSGSVLCGALNIAAVQAQSGLPGSVQPGQIDRQFQKEPEPRAKPGAITIPDFGQKPPVNAQAIRFILKRLTVDGVSVYPAELVRSLYESMLGKEVTLADIYRVAETLTAKYRNDGYILSQAVVPAQTVDNGTVRLQVFEGFVANVRVEGGGDALRNRVADYAEKMKSSRPLSSTVLERYLLLMNDLPGVTARATLVPSKSERGASDLLVQLTERMVGGGLSLDNRGSRALGPYRLSADMELYSRLGRSARTGIKVVTTGSNELNFLSLSHDQHVGSEGGKFGITASFTRSTPAELAIIPLNLETESNTVALAYIHPLVRSRTQNLYLRGTIGAYNGKTTIFGVDDTEDRIRVLRLGLTYDRADALV
jgi:hemolysin activation/secretion protein